MESVLDMALSTVSSLTESYVSGVSSLTTEDIPMKEKAPQESVSGKPEHVLPVQASTKETKNTLTHGGRENSDDEDGSDDDGVLAVHN